MISVGIAPLVEIRVIVHAFIGIASGVITRMRFIGGQKLPDTSVFRVELFIPPHCKKLLYLRVSINLLSIEY
jgi:hypothetical protein